MSNFKDDVDDIPFLDSFGIHLASLLFSEKEIKSAIRGGSNSNISSNYNTVSEEEQLNTTTTSESFSLYWKAPISFVDSVMAHYNDDEPNNVKSKRSKSKKKGQPQKFEPDEILHFIINKSLSSDEKQKQCIVTSLDLSFKFFISDSSYTTTTNTPPTPSRTHIPQISMQFGSFCIMSKKSLQQSSSSSPYGIYRKGPIVTHEDLQKHFNELGIVFSPNNDDNKDNKEKVVAGYADLMYKALLSVTSSDRCFSFRNKNYVLKYVDLGDVEGQIPLSCNGDDNRDEEVDNINNKIEKPRLNPIPQNNTIVPSQMLPMMIHSLSLLSTSSSFSSCNQTLQQQQDKESKKDNNDDKSSLKLLQKWYHDHKTKLSRKVQQNTSSSIVEHNANSESVQSKSNNSELIFNSIVENLKNRAINDTPTQTQKNLSSSTKNDNTIITTTTATASTDSMDKSSYNNTSKTNIRKLKRPAFHNSRANAKTRHSRKPINQFNRKKKQKTMMIGKFEDDDEEK